jgi:hypothetical protein
LVWVDENVCVTVWLGEREGLWLTVEVGDCVCELDIDCVGVNEWLEVAVDETVMTCESVCVKLVLGVCDNVCVGVAVGVWPSVTVCEADWLVVFIWLTVFVLDAVPD